MLIPLLEEDRRIGRKVFGRLVDQLMREGNAEFRNVNGRVILFAEQSAANARGLAPFRRAERLRRGGRFRKQKGRALEVPIAALVRDVNVPRRFPFEALVISSAQPPKTEGSQMMGRLVFIALLLAGANAAAECSVADFRVKITKVQWVDECRRRSCPHMRGAAVVTNKCQHAAGPQVRIVGLNKAGDPVTVRELWPFSTSNITPGTHPFSMDYWLDYDSEIDSFQVEVIRVNNW